MKVNKQWEVELIDPTEHHADIIQLFDEAFSEKISRSAYKWKYEDIPEGKMKVWGIWDNDKTMLIAAAAAYKRDFIFNNKNILVYQLADAMIHPDFQRQGIFKILTTKQLKDIAEEGTYFAFAYANPKSAGALKKMNNSNEIYLSNVFLYPIGSKNILENIIKENTFLFKPLKLIFDISAFAYRRVTQLSLAPKAKLKPIENFNDSIVNLSFENAANYYVFPNRTQRFMNWKGFNIPQNMKADVFNFQILSNNQILGYCILYRDVERNLLKIIDLICSPKVSTYKQSLDAIKRYAVVNNYDMISTNIAGIIHRKALLRAGFIKFNKIRCAILYAKEHFLQKKITGDFWYQSPIDRDDFYY